ncbi:Tryprostatin B 6-hydroxylase [Naviculisporaceae sp. PSN 640]
MSPTQIYLSTLAHDLSQQCLFSATLGLLVHTLYFIRGYHDQHALSIFLVHTFAYLTLTFFLPFLSATAIFLSYLTALFTSMTLYRLFFHPLRKFPGPFIAKITRLYMPFTNINGRMHHIQNSNFHKYNSDIIRIGPNELFIRDASAIQLIHGSKSGCRKRNAGIYNVVTFQGEPNLDSILDREPHRFQRQVWERAMTTKALASYEVQTREVLAIWVDKLSSAAKTQTPLNSTLYSLLVSFENMGKIAFSHDFGTLAAGKEVRMLHLLEAMFGGMAKIGELVWPMAMMQSLGVGGEAAQFDQLTMEMADRRIQAFEKGNLGAGSDIFSYLVEDYKSGKPIAYTNRNKLYADAGLMLVAATDTLAVVLSYSWYHLVNGGKGGGYYQEKLFEEIKGKFGKTVPGQFVDADLQSCELLDAIISETLRLENPVCNNASRTTPKEGLVLADGTYIPGGVSVRVPGYGMQRSEKAFVQPDEFIPERWTTKPELILDRAGFMPFLVGPNNCVGKRLAWMVLRLIVANTVYHFKFRFAPGEDGKDIYEKAQNQLVLTPGPLNLVFEKREN